MNIKDELEQSIVNGSGIFDEYELLDSNDRLLVSFSYDAEIDGLFLGFDMTLGDHYFSDDITIYETGIGILFDHDCETGLDDLFIRASHEINEGYLLPNDLLASAE